MTEAVLPLLIQQMLQPEFYDHPVTTPLQLIQTHISYVVLTGDYAYKVKKPLDFGFLNYSSLHRRRFFCLEELRLNQRAASELYLAVLPVVQTGDSPQFGPALPRPDQAEPDTDPDQPQDHGDAVEYVVQMRQFPQDALLSTQFEQGKLDEALLLRLAEVVAEFHQQAGTNDTIRSYGDATQIRQAIDENYAQTAAFIGGPQTQPQFDETKAYTDRFFAEQADLLEQRQAADKIRACHGDLHLGNIALWQDQLFLFDCIEFNRPFRYVDVMFDIAYIVMDLVVQGRQDLATAFVNHYVERTGDWDGLKVLPLYVSRQSYVRGKVMSFMLADPAIDGDTKAKITAQAAPYYTLAWQYAQPQAGRLVLMAGLSGSGKTTTARALAQKLGAVHLRSDAVRKHLAGLPLDQPGPDSLYTPEMSQRTYDRLLSLGTELAAAGYPVILDAKYDRVAMRKAAIAAANAQNLPLTILHCDAPAPVLEQRVAQRVGDIADATVSVLARQTFEPFTDAASSYIQRIDTTAPLEPQLASILGL